MKRINIFATVKVLFESVSYVFFEHENFKLDILFSGHPVEVCFFNGVHSMQGWTATARLGVTRKGSTKRSV